MSAATVAQAPTLTVPMLKTLEVSFHEPDSAKVARIKEADEARLYTIAYKHVLRAQRTGSLPDDKRTFAATAILAEYRQIGVTAPTIRDINLAIEVAVRALKTA